MNETERVPRRRRRPPWRPLAAAGLVAVVGTAAILVLNRPEREPAHFMVVAHAPATRQGATADRMADALQRCRALSADAEDQGCRAVWEANRRRFFDH